MEPEILWPETTIFWGAGATASLSIPLTEDQGKFLRAWGGTEGVAALTRELDDQKWPEPSKEHLCILLEALGHENKDEMIAEFDPNLLRRVQDRMEINKTVAKDLLVGLRQDYDWDALRCVMDVLPGEKGDANFIRDLFNILDMHIHGHLSFNVQGKGGDKRETLSQVRLIGARNCLVMLINVMIQGAYYGVVKNSQDSLEPYIDFVDALGREMQQEGVRLLDDGHARDSRAAYLFSYAVVSMNFDPVLLWIIFNAHKRLNHSVAPPHVGSPCQPLRLYNDMGHFMGCRKPKSNNEDRRGAEPWYPFNEAVVQRINDEEYNCGRVARVGKFYFPHGCSCWRECPSCGKLNMYLGDDWDDCSDTLFPPLPLQKEFMLSARTELEEGQRKKGRSDALSCGFCGAQSSTMHTPMVMQSSFKGQHPSFIEEIQRDMRACIENTRHFVLLGYSLPMDDVIYRALLASRKNEKNTFCSMAVGYQGEDRWITADELKQHVEDKHEDWEAIKSAIDIFGLENVRANFGGIPTIFKTPGNVETAIRDLLYPQGTQLDCFGDHGVIRPVP